MSLRSAELQRLLASLKGASSSGQTPDTGHASNAQQTGVQNGFPQNNENTATSQTSSNPAISNVPHQIVLDHSSLAKEASSVPADPRLAMKQPKFPTQNVERPRSSTPLAQPIPDASTITTWPSAVKHVTRHIVTNDQVAGKIKHLINEQRKHEEQWWRQRQEIMTRHAGRAGNQTKVADLLKELGGLAVPMVKVDEAADKNELEAFDKKVYKSLMQMAADFDGQLRKLGVPFFAIKHDLIISGDERENNDSTKGRLDKGELRELQKRMLQILEDLLVDG